MDWKWEKELRPGMTTHPILHSEVVKLPETLFTPDDDSLAQIFPGNAQSLKTWGRTKGVKRMDAHWIGVRKQTPLHFDPAYPRYTHQLLLRVDGFTLRGVDKQELELERGTYLLLDAHSPHQLYSIAEEALWYVAVSIDADDPQEAETMIPWLLDYADQTDLFVGLREIDIAS